MNFELDEDPYKFNGTNEISITRHGQSCTNIMGAAYALLTENKIPFELYGDGRV